MVEGQKPIETVQIPVPDGMTPERLVELVSSYEKRRVQNKSRQDSRKKAEKALREKYADEYKKLVEANSPKA